MKQLYIAGMLCLSALAIAQDVHFNYDRGASFASYRTYQWSSREGNAANQLMDQNIQRAIDEQLALKGMRRVEQDGDLQVAYQVALDRERQFSGYSTGPRWFGSTQVTTSTIEVGKLVVDLFDPAKKQLVWRGDAAKTLDIKQDPDKNYKNLQKAMAKLFKNYPPGASK
jgi:Domain of unknown function (DUF4136)